uniref:Protein TIC 214 n=1 Tax=Gnetum montanum TaxID=3381 RepID=R4L5R9_9SPER|nr:hypothetical protein M344_pgp004 [Gnetum montanum]AGL11085.1 hypothetical protein [Gnetum montanum]
MMIILKKASSDFCVGIFYGILSILSVGPSQFFAFRYLVLEGITESQIFMSGSFIGQLFIYLSVYNNSLYRALMKPHLMSLLAIPYFILRFYPPIEKWTNRILSKKFFLKNLKLYIFIDGFIIQLLNPFLFGNSTLTRLFSLLILRYNFSFLVFAGIILGWSVSYILCIKAINWIFSYMNKGSYLKHQIKASCELFLFVFLFCYFGSARIPLSIFPWRTTFYQVEDDDEEETQELTSERQEKNIVSKKEKQSKNEIVVSQIMASNNTETKDLKQEQTNLDQRKKKILKELQEFEQPELKQKTRTQNCQEIKKENPYSNWQQFSRLEWPNFFFNFQRWTRKAYIRLYEDFQPFLKARVSQYFFGQCFSDGKKRLCFTKFPTQFFLEQKLEKIHNTDYEDFWLDNLRNKKFYFWQELQDRIAKMSNADLIVRREDKKKYRVELAPIPIYAWMINFEETLQKYLMQCAYRFFREKTIPWILKKKREISMKKQVLAIRKEALEKRVQLILPGGDNLQLFNDPLLCGSSRVLVKHCKWAEIFSQVRLRTFTEEYGDEQKKRIEERAIENLWKMVEKKVEENEWKEKEQQEKEQQSVLEIKKGRGSIAVELPKEEEQLTTEQRRLLATENVQEKLDFYDTVKTRFSLRFEEEKHELIKQFFSEEQQEQGQTKKKNSEFWDLLNFHDYLNMKDTQDPLLDYTAIPKRMVFRSSIYNYFYLKKSYKTQKHVSSKFRTKKYSLPWKPFFIKTRSILSTTEASSKEQNTQNLIFQEQKLTDLDIGIISEKIYLNDVYISKNFCFKILYKQTDQKKKTFRNPLFFDFFSLLLFDEKSRGFLLEFLEKIEWDLIERLIEVKKKKRMEFKCIKQRTNNNFFRVYGDITKELPEGEHYLIQDYEYEDQTNYSDFRAAPLKNMAYYEEGDQQFLLKGKHASCNNRLYMFKGTTRPRKGKCVKPFRAPLRSLKNQAHSPLVLQMKKFQKRKPDFQKVRTSIQKFQIRLFWKFCLIKLMKIYNKFKLFHSRDEEQNKKKLNAHKISFYKRKYYANLAKLDHHIFHKIRGPILIFQAFFRQKVVLPFLIGIKNVGRILLLQTPEIIEDWKELSAEVYINCTFDGVEFSEQKRPERWWEDGFQIKILNPFRLKPWHEAFGTSQKVKPTYMSIGGYEVDTPYGDKVKKFSFWKPVLTEIKKLSEIPTDSALVFFLSKVNQVVYKLRWVCTQINSNWVPIEIDISKKIKKIKTVITNRLSSFGYTTGRKRPSIRKRNRMKKKEEKKQSYHKNRFFWVRKTKAKVKMLTKTFISKYKQKTKAKVKMLTKTLISKYKQLHFLQNEIAKLKEIILKYKELFFIQYDIIKLNSEIFDKDVFQKEKSPNFRIIREKMEFRVSNWIHNYRKSNKWSDFFFRVLPNNFALSIFYTKNLCSFLNSFCTRHFVISTFYTKNLCSFLKSFCTRHFVLKIKRIFLLNRKKITTKQKSFSLNNDNILSQAYVFHDIWRCTTNNKPFFKPFLQSKETYPFIKKKIRTFLGQNKLLKYKKPHALKKKDWKHWLKCYDRYDLSSKLVWFHINPKRVRNKIRKLIKRKYNKNINPKKVRNKVWFYINPKRVRNKIRKLIKRKHNKNINSKRVRNKIRKQRKHNKNINPKRNPKKVRKKNINPKKVRNKNINPKKVRKKNIKQKRDPQRVRNKNIKQKRDPKKVRKKNINPKKVRKKNIKQKRDPQRVRNKNIKQKRDPKRVRKKNINPKRVRNKIRKLIKQKHKKNILENRLFLKKKLQNKPLPVFTSFKKRFLFKLNKCYRFNILAYNYLDSQETGISQLFFKREKTKRIGVYPAQNTSLNFLLNYILGRRTKKKGGWPVKMNDQLMTELEGIFEFDFVLKNRKEQKEDEKVEIGRQKMALRRFIIKPCIFSVQKRIKWKGLSKSERKLARKTFKKSFEIISTQDKINSEIKKQKNKAFDLKKQREAAAKKKKLIQKKRLLTKAERDGMNVTEKKKSIEKELEILLEQEIQLKKEEESQAELLKTKKKAHFNKNGLQGLIKENDKQQLFDKVIDRNFIGKQFKNKKGFVFFFWSKSQQKEENIKKLQVTNPLNKPPKITSKKNITVEYKLFSQEDLDKMSKDPEYKKREEHLQKLLDFVDEQKDDELIDEEIDDDMYILFPRKFYREILLWRTLNISYVDLNRQLTILRKMVNNPVKKKALTNIYLKDMHLEPLYFMCDMRSLGFRQKDFPNVLLKRTANPIAQLPTERVLTKRLINLFYKPNSEAFDFKLDNFILEDVFIPRHRKEFRVLNRLFFSEVGFQKEQRPAHRYFFLKKKKLWDSGQKIKRFLWPNYRLEDLLCMNRFWYNITDGSCNSIVRLRMYPLF